MAWTRRRQGRKSGRIQGRFLPLMDELLDSPVWRLLTPAQQSIYIMMLRAWRDQDHFQLNLNTAFVFPYHCCPHSDSTISKAIRAFEKYGLIKFKKPGGLFRNMSLYQMSQKWKTYEPTSEETSKLMETQQALRAKGKRSHERRSRILAQHREMSTAKNEGTGSPESEGTA